MNKITITIKRLVVIGCFLPGTIQIITVPMVDNKFPISEKLSNHLKTMQNDERFSVDFRRL